MDRWCRRIPHVDSEQVVSNWFRQIGATDPCHVGQSENQGPPDWVINYSGHTIAVEVTLLHNKKEGWSRTVEISVEDKLCRFVERVTSEHGSPLIWQVECEYDPNPSTEPMKPGKWENRALEILRRAAAKAPVSLKEIRLLPGKNISNYRWGVFLNVVAVPTRKNIGCVQVTSREGEIVKDMVIANASSSIKKKAEKVRKSIARGERSRCYEDWWLVFDDEVIRVPGLHANEWKCIDKEIQECTGIDVWRKVVLVNRFQPGAAARPTSRWYHAFWEEAGHPPLPPSPPWGVAQD